MATEPGPTDAGEARDALSSLLLALRANFFHVDPPLLSFRIGAGRSLLSRVDIDKSEIVTLASDEFPVERRFKSFAAYFSAARGAPFDGGRQNGKFATRRAVYSPYAWCDVRFTRARS